MPESENALACECRQVPLPETCADAVRDSLAGAPAAREVLAERVRRLSFPVIASRLRIRPDLDADDVVQETSLRVWLRLAGWAGRVDFCGWVRVVARHAAIDALQGRPFAITIGSGSDLETRPGSTRSPLDDLLGRESADHIRLILAELPEHYQILMTRRAEGVRMDDIAEELHTTRSATQRWLADILLKVLPFLEHLRKRRTPRSTDSDDPH